MSSPADPAEAPRPLDGRAVEHALARLSRRPEPPWLHCEVGKRMAEKLSVIKMQPDHVLDWWSTLGASTELLAAAYPKARHTVVEPEAFIAQRRPQASLPWWALRRRWSAPPAALLESEVSDGDAQLLWANMMLHAARMPQAVFARWHRALAVDGFVMFSTLGPDTLRELRELYARLGWPPPMAELVDMHDLGDMLVHAGFADPVMDQETLTLTWPTPEALQAELRGLGANAHPQRFAGLRTPRWSARLREALRSVAGDDGRLKMRFEVIYGHAFKPVPRARVAEDTRISLDDMRAMTRAKR